MNPKKQKKKQNKNFSEKKKQNSAIQKPTTAVRQTESKRGESSERVHERGRRKQRKRGGSMRHGKKKRGRAVGKSRESAQLCV